MKYIQRSLWVETKMDIELFSPDRLFRMREFFKHLIFTPEFQVLLSYRLQYRLFKMGVFGMFAAKILQLFTRAYSGCWIGYYAKIEGGVRLVHTVGIVIGEHVLLKSGVQVYQNVTIGDAAQINEFTKVYPGAVITGQTQIGKNCRIGANSVILKNVPDNSTAVGIRIITH